MPEQQEELGLSWLYGNSVPPHLLPPVASLRHSILLSPTLATAPHVLQARKAIETQNSVPNDNFKNLPAPQAQQSQKAIAAAQEHPKLEPGSFYKNVNYVPPDIPPVPSIQHLIQICSKPFEKQLAQTDATRDLRLKDCDVETHILPLLNPSEDPKQGISVGWKHFVNHHGRNPQLESYALSSV